MTLLEILVRELPKRGGWPAGVAAMAQDDDGSVQNYSDTYDIRIDSYHAYGMSRIVESYSLEEGEVSAGADRLTAIITREQYESALASVEPEWEGEGLPPVGCECQYRKHKKSEQSEWFNGAVKYASEFTVVIQPACYAGETIGHPANFEFRPIRSEADKKRDSIIQMIERAYKDCPHSEAVPQAIYEAIAEHLRID